MSYWLRELFGWLLVLCGLGLFLVVYDFCYRRWIFEAGIVAVVGIFVFRGGIHLLKVAIAARICRQIQARPPAGRFAEPVRRSAVMSGRTTPGP